MVIFLVELNLDILVGFTLPFIEECHRNGMVQSLTIHTNVSFVPLPAKGAGCFSSAHVYVHNFNYARLWFESMPNARG